MPKSVWLGLKLFFEGVFNQDIIIKQFVCTLYIVPIGQIKALFIERKYLHFRFWPKFSLSNLPYDFC